MSKGITQDCAMLWRTIAKKGGWWSVLRLAHEWSPTFSLAEIEEHLVTLHRGGFLQAWSLRNATVYGFTAKCHALPGGLNLQEGPTVEPQVPAPRRPDVMHTHYAPPQPLYRPGALDHLKHPSLHMGQRTLHRGALA